MSRLTLTFVIGVIAVLAIVVWAKIWPVGETPPSDPQGPAPNPQSPTTEESMAVTHKIVVGGLRCQLGDAEPSECEDVCKNVAKSSGPVDLDAGAGSHQVVEELCRCLKEAGVEVRMVSQSRCPRSPS